MSVICDMIFRKKENRSKKLFTRTAALLLSMLIALSMTACSGGSEYSKAMDAYKDSDYETARVHFEKAMLEKEVEPGCIVAYGFDLVMLGEYEECINVVSRLTTGGDLYKLTETLIRDAYCVMAYAAFKMADYGSAIDYYKETKLVTDDPDARDNIDSCILESYMRLFVQKMDEKPAMKALVMDELVDYVGSCDRALSGRVYQFLAGMCIYMNDELPEQMSADRDLLSMAEEYVSQAYKYDDVTVRDLEKYSIIIAERRGKADVAYKLLDVFVMHFPDEESAVTEQAFLMNRMGER